MSSIDGDEIIRLQVAEEAVRIVRQFNSTKRKEERQKKIIDLCTDIAGILDAKRRLENLVEKQNAELEELRKQNKTAQNATTSERGSISPEEAQETNRLVLCTPSSGRGSEDPQSCSSRQDSEVPRTLSSGRGTTVYDKGTDPAYVWPEKTSTCTRSTSPVLVSILSSMDLLDGSRENLNSEGEKMDRDAVDAAVRYREEGNKSSSSGKRIAGNDKQHEDERIEDSWVGQDNKTDENADNVKNETKEKKKKNSESPHGKSNILRKCRQSSQQSGRAETRPKSKEKSISLPPRESSPRKSAADRKLYKAKEKTYKTLWKTDQFNLFDRDNNSGTKQRKSKMNNQATDKNSAGGKLKNARKAGLGKSTVDWQRQSESWWAGEESEGDEELTREAKPEPTAEYWDIHKLIRYLKIGNPTATVISLCALRDLSLDQESSQLAILDLGGINILLNLLRTGHWRCLVGSLKILRLITTSRHINREIYRLGGIQQLHQCLHHHVKEIQSLAAETLSHVVTFHLANSAARRCGVIEQLVNLLQPYNKKRSLISPKDADDFQLTTNACFALWSCSKNPKNIQAIRAAGAVPILTSLLVSGNDDIILPAMGIVQECASQTAFREDVRREGMVEGIVQHLRKGDIPLKTICTNALFKCAEDDSTREIISRKGGLELLVEILASRSLQNKELLAATIGALWKCALNKNNVKRLQHLGTVKTLIFLLKSTNQSHEVIANVLGAMHEFAQSKQTLLSLKEEGVIPVVVKLLTSTESVVLINATRLLAVFGKEASCRSVVLRTDGLRLLWSLLKCPDPKVIAGSADAICECVVEAEVLICVNRAIINIGLDRENLSIMTDYQVVPLLISLSYTEDDNLKRWVAEAIATCSRLDKNVRSFSSAVLPLADSLKRSSRVELKRAIVCALQSLSCDPYNCSLIHQHQALKTLVTLTGSVDQTVQEAAAGCIKNMRVNTMRRLAP